MARRCSPVVLIVATLMLVVPAGSPIGAEDGACFSWELVLNGGGEIQRDTRTALDFRAMGGAVDFIQDPTGNGRGLVARATIGSEAGSSPQSGGAPGTLAYAADSHVSFPFEGPPCTFEVDVWANDELVTSGVTCEFSATLLEVHDACRRAPDAGAHAAWGSYLFGCWTDPFGASVNVSLQVVLWWASVRNGQTYLNLKYGGTSGVAEVEPGAPAFTPNVWHTLTLRIDASRNAELLQDGISVSRHALNPCVAGGTTGGQAGLYVYDSSMRGRYAVHGVLLYDNFRITCGPCVSPSP
jgi:hypothetical protein